MGGSDEVECLAKPPRGKLCTGSAQHVHLEQEDVIEVYHFISKAALIAYAVASSTLNINVISTQVMPIRCICTQSHIWPHTRESPEPW
jgi:hypothetical protein